MKTKLTVSTLKRLLDMSTIQRVPLPEDVPDDSHNRIDGLIELITENFPENAKVMELGTGMGISTEVFALLCGEVHTTDVWADGLSGWRASFEAIAKNYENITQYYKNCDECVELFADESLDAVYIDELHYYEDVKKDIINWLPKVKRGGLICGHDYIERPDYQFGVIRAVNEVLGAPEKIYQDTSWIVRKP